MTRLLDLYKQKIISELMTKLGYKNKLAVPKLTKIVVNMGVGKALENKKAIEDAVKHLSIITGQKPLVTKARKSIAGFKLRKGSPIGCKVTLRGRMMYEFFDRLISIALPRIRDFRGLSPKAFDGQGNYTLGITEQVVFPEINIDTVELVQGMDITFVVTGKDAKHSFELLKLFGIPFRA
ncbi:MAG: 50S ribosomal protein L5 [Candidatus Brocadiales bacterium]